MMLYDYYKIVDFYKSGRGGFNKHYMEKIRLDPIISGHNRI